MTRFRVYPSRRGRLFFEVRIYRDRRAMLRALRRNDRLLGLRLDWSESEAVCRSYEWFNVSSRRRLLTPQAGVVFFHRRALGAGIVAHELTHAAVQWARRIGLSGRRVWRQRGREEARANERFAFAVGNLCAQFWTEYYRRRRRR